jgi:hypothetical protein
MDVKSEKQAFRSEANGSLPLSGHRSSVVDWKSKTYDKQRAKSENDFETAPLGVFATPGSLLAPGGPYVQLRNLG